MTDMSRLVMQAGDGIGLVDEPESSSNGHNAVTFLADHDHACGPPSTTRTIVQNNNAANHVYWCPNATGHFMTAMNTTSYNLISLAPRDGELAKVFPAEANRICFDVNITDFGNRRWWDVMVLSEATYRSNSFPTWTPAGTVDRPTLIYFDPNHIDANLKAGINADFQFVYFQGSTHIAQNGVWFSDNHNVPDRDRTLVPYDKATRYRHCIRDNGNGTITFTQNRPGGTVASIVMQGRFPAGPKVFVIQDASYNPDKAENPAAGQPSYTWHWDNITIGAS